MTARHQVLVGDALEQLLSLPTASVHCAVTSPPYWAMRDYEVAGQLGREATPEWFVTNLVSVLREVRRVLHPTGTLWLNLGDTYANSSASGPQGASGERADRRFTAAAAAPKLATGLKPKDLVGIPWRVAFALQADGWWLRAACPWVKRSAMPESVRDRPKIAHEYVFLLTPREQCFYDVEAARLPASGTSHDRGRGLHPKRARPGAGVRANTSNVLSGNAGITRCRRTTDWYFEGLLLDDDEDGYGAPLAFEVNATAFKGSHYATFPRTLVRPCVQLGTSEHGCCAACLAPWERVLERTPRGDWHGERDHEGVTGQRNTAGLSYTDFYDRYVPPRTVGWRPTCACDAGSPVPCTVLDPFVGTGTTLAAALELGRNAIGIDLDPRNVAFIERRLAPLLAQPSLALSSAGAT